MNARTSLRTCDDHCRTMNALVNADGVPPDFINGADATEAAALAQQPWYCVLYVAQVRLLDGVYSTEQNRCRQVSSCLTAVRP